MLTILIVIIAAVELVLIAVAAFKSNQGENYRYPFTIRFLS
ncbi:MAG: DUF4870 domain-containing protein [Dethiobacter sp.]|nr:DUF4870 domain-containing protein [Dethiobacter sp.]